jgi:hypothetical protein
MKKLLFNPLQCLKYFFIALLLLHFVSCATYQNSSYYDADGIYGGEVKVKPKIQSNDYYQSYFSNLKSTTIDTLDILSTTNKKPQDSLKTNTTIVNIYPNNQYPIVRGGFYYNDLDYYGYYSDFYGWGNRWGWYGGWSPGWYNDWGWYNNWRIGWGNNWGMGWYNNWGWNNGWGNYYPQRYSTGRRGQAYTDPYPRRRYSQQQNTSRNYNFSSDNQQQVNRRRYTQPERTYVPTNNQNTRQNSTPTRTYSPPQQETRTENRSYNNSRSDGGAGRSPSSGGRRR